MSDSYITIVPKGVSKTEAKELAQKLVRYLVQRGVIKGELTDCTLGDHGHPPGDHFTDAIGENDFGLKNLLTNGFSVTAKKEVFQNGGNGLEEITCPDCNVNIIETDWPQAIDEWFNETGQDKISCPDCYTVHSITDYNFKPAWGFGYLGFTFWNWPSLKEVFIKEVEQVLGKEVYLVYGRI